VTVLVVSYWIVCGCAGWLGWRLIAARGEIGRLRQMVADLTEGITRIDVRPPAERFHAGERVNAWVHAPGVWRPGTVIGTVSPTGLVVIKLRDLAGPTLHDPADVEACEVGAVGSVEEREEAS
jgi:hypothetical protein